MKRKLIFIFIIISMILIPSYQVEAKTLRQLQEELNKLEKDYNENKNKKSLTQSEINTLNSQINTINANIINTKIVGQSLKVSPLLVIFAITVGGAYFGMLGMFLAVPVSAVVKILVEDYVNWKLSEKKKQSEIG